MRQPLPAYCYIEVERAVKLVVARTIEIGPKEMFYAPDGSEAGQHMNADILVDVDAFGNVVGVELLTKGTLHLDTTMDDGELVCNYIPTDEDRGIDNV